MSRNMDAHKDLIARFSMLSDESTKLGRELRKIDEAKKELGNQIIAKMGNSTEATLDGKVAFTVEPTTRRDATIALVMEHAPQLKDKLIKVTHGKKIKFAMRNKI